MKVQDAWAAAQASLALAIGRMGMSCPAGFPQDVILYLQLLERWNHVYNLTAIKGPEAMLTGHILDCLAIEPHIQGPRVVDVGTGPGLPGLVLALMHRDWAFVLLDSNRRKLAFVTQAVVALGLKNVRVEHVRVEDYRPEKGFNSVVSRAFSSASTMVQLAGHLMLTGHSTWDSGRMVMMKGRVTEETLDELRAQGGDVTMIPLYVPGLDAVRHLLVYRQQTDLENR